MSLHHNSIFFSCQESHTYRLFHQRLFVLIGIRHDNIEISTDKFFIILSGSSKINQIVPPCTYSVTRILSVHKSSITSGTRNLSATRPASEEMSERNLF
ncbi:hypothetical protein ACHAXS_010078 [Conticribra weissflogii]